MRHALATDSVSPPSTSLGSLVDFSSAPFVSSDGTYPGGMDHPYPFAEARSYRSLKDLGQQGLTGETTRTFHEERRCQLNAHLARVRSSRIERRCHVVPGFWHARPCPSQIRLNRRRCLMIRAVQPSEAALSPPGSCNRRYTLRQDK
jgi:hypothetical protein